MRKQHNVGDTVSYEDSYNRLKQERIMAFLYHGRLIVKEAITGHNEGIWQDDIIDGQQPSDGQVVQDAQRKLGSRLANLR